MGIVQQFSYYIFKSNDSSPVFSARSRCENGYSYDSDSLIVLWVGGIALTIVCILGIGGHILSIIVLTRPAMRSSTSLLLLGLAICDFAFLLISLLCFGLVEILNYACVWLEYVEHVYPQMATVLLPVWGTVQVGSVYFIIVVSLERGIVVYKPLWARSLCTIKHAAWASATVTAFAIGYRIITFWGRGLSYAENTDTNGTTIWSGYIMIRTEFWKTPAYQLYYVNWSSNVINRFIPFTTLIVLNLLIYAKIREASRKRKTMTLHETNEFTIAKTLVWLVSTFIICYSLRLYLNLNQSFSHGNHSPVAESISTFSVSFNSAVNFYIYCLVGKKFRRTCKQVLCVSKADYQHA